MKEVFDTMAYLGGVFAFLILLAVVVAYLVVTLRTPDNKPDEKLYDWHNEWEDMK